MVWGLSLLFVHCLATFFLTRLIVRPKSRAESIVGFYLLFTTAIVVMGQLLSLVNLFHDVRAWLGLVALLLVGTLGIAALKQSWRELVFQPLTSWKDSFGFGWWKDLSPAESALIVWPIAVLALIGLTQLHLITTTAPSHWDSMTLHLARLAFYLQQGNLSPFDTSWVGLTVHPTAGVSLHAYAYLSSGGNESFLQIVNWFSYVVCMISIVGICRLLNVKLWASLIAGISFGLLPICILQSVSTQTDLQYTGWIAACTYFLISYYHERQPTKLILAAIGAALPLGIKSAAFLAMPAIGVVVCYVTLRATELSWKRRLGDLGIFTAAGFVTCLAVIVPSGYYSNYVRHRHPMGSGDLRYLHSFDGRPAQQIFYHGTANVCRYALSFGRMDGMPREIGERQSVYLQPLQDCINRLGLPLDNPDACRVPAWPYSQCLENALTCEDESWWGVLGFGLIWPCVIWTLFSLSSSGIARTFAVACVVYFMAQCYSGPYDPWRGRYFIHCALFALPCVGFVISQLRSRLLLCVLSFVLFMGFWGAGYTVIRCRAKLDDQAYPGRLGQMFVRNAGWRKPFEKYERMVPENAVVAIFLPGDFYLYPIFGKHLQRKVYSRYDFLEGKKALPAEAEYYLFHACVDKPKEQDVELGYDLYLRRLSSPDSHAWQSEK